MPIYAFLLVMALSFPLYIIGEVYTYFSQSIEREKNNDAYHISTHFSKFIFTKEEIKITYFQFIRETHDKSLYGIAVVAEDSEWSTGVYVDGTGEAVNHFHTLRTSEQIYSTGQLAGRVYIYYDISHEIGEVRDLITRISLSVLTIGLVVLMFFMRSVNTKKDLSLRKKALDYTIIGLPTAIIVSFFLSNQGNILEAVDFYGMESMYTLFLMVGGGIFLFMTAILVRYHRVNSELSETDNELQDSLDTISNAMDSIGIGIICVKKDSSDIVYQNSVACDYLGEHKSIFAAGIQYDAEWWEFDDHHLHLSWVKEHDNNDILILRDNTKHRLMELRLEESEKMLRTILDTIPINVFWKNREGGYSGHNKSFTEELDLPDDIIGKTVFDLFPESVAERIHASDMDIMKSGKARIGVEEWLNIGSNVVVHEVSKVPLLNDNEEVIGLLGVSRDITKRRDTEQSLYTTKKQLEETIIKLNSKHRVVDAISTLQSNYIFHNDPNEVFCKLIELMSTITNSQYGFIMDVFSEHQEIQKLEICGTFGIKDRKDKVMGEITRTDNLIGFAVKTKKHLISEDLSNDPRCGGRMPKNHVPVLSFLCIPLIVYDVVVGVIGLANRKRNYTEELVEELKEVTDTCAYILVSHKNDNRRKSIEHSLIKSEELFRTITDSTHDAILNFNSSGIITFWNSGAEMIFGYTEKEILGISFQRLLPPRYWGGDRRDAGVRSGDFKVMNEHDIEIIGLHRSGKEIPLEVSIKQLMFDEVTHMAVVRDIFDRKKHEKNLYNIAYYDKLTGIPNRRLVDEIVEEAILLSKEKKAAMMFIDLDRFKYVNDTFGHSAGDVLLQESTNRVKGVIRETDSLIRLGGDEFLAVLPNTEVKATERIAHGVLEVLADDFDIDVARVNISGSIGISYYPDHGESVEDLMQRADIAMYRAKDLGRNKSCTYSAELGDMTRINLKVENKLRYIEFRRFNIMYQPIVSVSGETKSVEALLRWFDPDLGTVSPEDFIPIMEELGRMPELGEWVLENAITEMMEKDISCNLSINVSVSQLNDPKFLQRIDGVLQRTGYTPSHLDFEVTENVVVKDIELFIRTLKSLMERGIGISIDDFGTGYCSFGYLQYLSRLNIKDSGGRSYLKMDKSFIRNLDAEGGDVLAKQIISLAHGMGLHVIAEGVEQREELDFLRENNCDNIQGFLFSRPDTLNNLLARQDIAQNEQNP